MRIGLLGMFLLAGTAWGQTAQTAPSGSTSAMPQATVAEETPNFFVQTSPLPMQFVPQQKLPEKVWLPGKFSAPKPGSLLTQHGPLPALNESSAVVTTLTQLAAPGAIPIPTQWPQAKMEAIPTRWPNLKFTPIGGAGAAADSGAVGAAGQK